ncbi:hypothetical protein BH10PSE17_BH10PSE17_06240 [soil metagenome]
MTTALRWIATPHIPPDFLGPGARPYRVFGDPASGVPIIDSLRGVVEEWPNGVAVEDAVGILSFSDLWRAALQLAALIERAQPAPGNVGIMLPASAGYMVAVFACLAANRVMVALDEASPDARNIDIIERTSVTLVLATPDNRRAGYAGAPVLAVDLTLPVDATPVTWTSRPVDLDAPAVIVCTSGSSGRPKPIVHSQRAMLSWARIHHNSIHMTHRDRVLSLSSAAALAGFSSFFTTPLAGAATQIVDVKSVGLGGLLETLATKPVTTLRAAPSMLRGLARLPEARRSFAGLRVIQAFGEPLLKADVIALRQSLAGECFIRSTYGTTESSGLQWFASEGDSHDTVRVAAGVLQPDTEAAIVDEDGNSCCDGQAGELWIRSRYNALGEWVNGRVVPGRMLPDDAAAHSRIYKTGDMAVYHGDGVFTVIGRKDRMVKVNGQRLEPGEIEVALRAVPAVREAEVVIDPRSAVPRLLAFVVACEERGGAELVAALRAELRNVLPGFMMPSKIVVVPAMPRLPNGKIDGLSLLARIGVSDTAATA